MEDNFTVKERGVGAPCFVYIEGKNIAIELREPADLEHAQKVAQFLRENVSEIVVQEAGQWDDASGSGK
jgi:hypothetical protein